MRYKLHHHQVAGHGDDVLSFLFIYFWGGGGEMSLFPSIICTIVAFSLNGEHVVRSFLPHGLDF